MKKVEGGWAFETEDEAHEYAELVRRRFLESFQAYDNLRTRKLKEWGIEDDKAAA